MKGFIGYFDILGYQNFLKNNSAEESVNKVLDIIHKTPDLIKETTKFVIEESDKSENLNEDDKLLISELSTKLKHLVFSDTIVITLELPDKEITPDFWEYFHSIIFFSNCMSVLTENMHINGLPGRCVIHEGEFFRKETSLAGSGIVEAYRLCETINFSGIVCSNELTKKLLSKFNDIEDKLSFIENDSNIMGLFTYLVPKKDGSEERLVAINWLHYLTILKENENLISQCRQDIQGFILKAFWAHQKDCSSAVDIKINNTEKYFRKMLYNIDINKEDLMD